MSLAHAPLWKPDLTEYERATIPEGAQLPLNSFRTLVVDGGNSTRLMARVPDDVLLLGFRLVAYEDNRTGMHVIASMDPTARFGLLLHVSMSYPKHDPTWQEIKMVKSAFFGPHRDAIMVLAADRDWVNVHEHCFHLSEAPERWGMR